ncbi:MAG: SUMF1/EgtB/PvdO family nonheme iron enzyme [Bacteroidales bacterium]|nr:SUMF1/EgtB/PvdO family nonheme iron enzyme [Bacteroidales bacterium]
MKKNFLVASSGFVRMIVFFVLFATCIGAEANNVHITNVTNTNPGAADPIITFDIAWDNSWRVSTGPNNYDAVWIFVKYQQVPTGSPNCESYQEWHHSKMTNVPGDFSVGAPLEIVYVGDSMGIYVQRSADGVGNVSTTSVTIRLNLDVPVAPFDPEFNFKIFGIEMVYVPQGDFELGDGISTNTFNSISITNTTTTLSSATVGGGIHQTIPSAFPKGYSAFYSMKYEVTQQQYVDFLNTLTFDQQVTRTILTSTQIATDPGAGGLCAMISGCLNRNSIKLIQEGVNNSRAGVFACDFQPAPGDPFNSVNDGQPIASNYMSYGDLLAYLDWAALRPMTNFEFEKISRGPLARLGNEYIWGNLNITQAQSTSLNNPGTASETSTVIGDGLSAYGSLAANGPLRVGFSATAATTRETSGSSYYGVMNLGGNVWEMVAGGSNSANTGYQLTYSSLGDGEITSAGAYNTPNWQMYNSISYSTLGCGCCSSYIKWHMEMRGGSFSSAATTLRISDRSKNATSTCGGGPDFGFGNTGDQRQSDVGGRGVR